MIKNLAVIALLIVAHFTPLHAQDGSVPTIDVDKNGVMRWSDTGEEAAFYGVNYSVPFAHGYRAIGYLGIDHKEAIDRDVYHFSRLGFNAYRIHVWDVEISDSVGNLLENEHLDLLDYLIAKLRERGIRTVITCMTNFGNGYPERNQPMGGFTYLYDKCEIHNHPEAIKAQERYVNQLVQHENPYTGVAYQDDPYVVGFEINNEPCHTGNPAQTTAYIDRMLAAIEKAGNTKPIFYNVSHNMDHVGAYFDAEVQGATYQWYPFGLVAGFTRKGNFLPYLDQYNMPFESLKGAASKAKIVYEFDPADGAYTYLYPTMARTFRSQGFQWITQFAYDPIDIARYNTDYQTHYLNLAYTPGKAISMKIAAEVTRLVARGASFGRYPADTLFGDFLVSHRQNLSVLNNAKAYYYSNHTTEQPIAPAMLETVAGVGRSPIVTYEGTGAYFLDRLAPGVWRLEVMPDAIPIADPHGKPALDREAVTIAWNTWHMQLVLPDLGQDFHIGSLQKGHTASARQAKAGLFEVQPGVYLLCKPEVAIDAAGRWTADTRWQEISLGEYVAPEAHTYGFSVVHEPATVVNAGEALPIGATIVGPVMPDSIVLHTDRVSFWSSRNPRTVLKRIGGYRYEGVLPHEQVTEGTLRYTITVYHEGHATTYPDNRRGAPLDWDYPVPTYWQTQVVTASHPIVLIDPGTSEAPLETYAIPETSYSNGRQLWQYPELPKAWHYTFSIQDTNTRFFWRRDITDVLANRQDRLAQATYICLSINHVQAMDSLAVGFTSTDGYTHYAHVTLDGGTSLLKIPLSAMELGDTPLLPSPYPVFLDRYFSPALDVPFDHTAIELLVLATLGQVKEDAAIAIGNVWLE